MRLPDDPEGAVPDVQVLKQAVAWLVILWSGEAGPADKAACERWRHADPTHEVAWQRVLALDKHVDGLPETLARSTLRKSSELRTRRRTIVRSLLVMGGVGGMGLASLRSQAWQHWVADYRVATGALQQVELDDGSRVTMNTATDLDVRFTTQERRLKLLAGEIFVETGHHDAAALARPFLVETPQGTVHALGTRFTVRDANIHSRVAVLTGAVDVVPRHADRPARIDAGWQVSFTSESLHGWSAADPDDNAWTRGQLIAERMRLDDFLKELARYRSGWIRCDPVVGDLLVSGVFPLLDTTRVLTALQKTLPVRVRHWGRYWVTVGAA